MRRITELMEEKEINLEDVRSYWKLLYETDYLGDDKTIRIVPQIAKGDKQIVFTSNEQINFPELLFQYIEDMNEKNKDAVVGYSISAAVFDYDPNNKDEKGKVVTPSIKSFSKIKKVVIDVDIYIHKTKERFILGTVDMDSINVVLLAVYSHIIKKMQENNLPVIKPAACALTGSGLQIIFNLDRWLNKEEATIFFNYLKKVIDKERINVFTENLLGGYSFLDAEIDPTFADITHVQRVVGTINQKNLVRATFLNILNSKNAKTEVENLRQRILEKIENSGYPQNMTEIYLNFVNNVIDKTLEILSKESVSQIKTEEYINISKIEKYSYSSNNLIKPSSLKSIEYELLHKLKAKGINSVDLVRDHINIDHETKRFIAVKCPFHGDRRYSFAIYINDAIDIFHDFHDNKSYTLVTFWEKLFNVNKTTAISQIAQKAGIKLGKMERKDFESLEIEETVDSLLEKVDTENYVYYRLANKNRTCIIRNKNTGEAFIFDGPKMLALHVLGNQLNVNNVNKAFIQKFQEKFEEKLLLVAFEEFAPGKPTIFQKDFIKFVNLWVPSKNYQAAHDIAKNLNDIELKDSLKVIKDKCPWTYKYLLQITQRGNLLWLINWLANTAHFNVMSTIPVIFGTPGVGKNLFINTIIEWYHNSEYTKILNSDRVMSNFNGILENASFIALDEGDISSSKDFDALKFLSGNNKIAIEKKGVDTQMKKRFFNIILFSNGEVPIRHHSNDRRIQYFYTKETLINSCVKWGLSIEEFIENVEKEQAEFWAILLKIKRNKKWSISNEKDKLFMIQIFKQHGFGDLILKLLRKEWDDITLQMNENVQDNIVMKTNLTLLNQIQQQYNVESKISLTLVNKYLHALNYKYKTSIQQFIKSNNLINLGIKIEIEKDDVKIKLDESKLNNICKIKNLLDLDDQEESIELIKREIENLYKYEENNEEINVDKKEVKNENKNESKNESKNEDKKEKKNEEIHEVKDEEHPTVEKISTDREKQEKNQTEEIFPLPELPPLPEIPNIQEEEKIKESDNFGNLFSLPKIPGFETDLPECDKSPIQEEKNEELNLPNEEKSRKNDRQQEQVENNNKPKTYSIADPGSVIAYMLSEENF